MVIKFRIIILFAFFMQVLTLSSQQKYALLIGIQNYPQGKNIGGSHTILKGPKNDIVLVQELLQAKGFANVNVTVLQDEIATALNVLAEFEKLVKKVKQGDIVYIHYCGHGQQIADCNKDDYPNLKYVSYDEGDDGYDEAWALYNAPNTWFEGYNYSEHLIDDQLGYFLNEIDKKIGVDGHLVFVSDACHSGTIDRSLFENTRSGDKCIPFDYKARNYIEKARNIDVEENSMYSTKSIFYACTNNQLAGEIKVGDSIYGNFTYSFIRAIQQLDTNASYENIYNLTGIKMSENYQNTYNNGRSNQTPEKYFEKPTRIFLGNQNIKRDLRHKIKYGTGDICTVNAGPIHGFEIGDKVGVYRNDLNTKEVPCIGYVSDIKSATESQIKLDTLLFSNINYYKFYIRKILPSSSTIFSVKLDKSLSSKNKKKVKELLRLKSFVSIAEAKQPLFDLYVKQNGDERIYLEVGSSGNPFKKMFPLFLHDTAEFQLFLKYIDSARDVFQFLSLEFFDNLGIEVKTSENEKGSNENFININQFDFDVTNNSNSSYFIKAWYIDEFMGVNKLDDDFSRIISAKNRENLKLTLGCDRQYKCGTSWVYVFFTKDDLDFYFTDGITDKRSALNSNPKLFQQSDSSKKYVGDGIYLVKFRIDLE